MRGSLFATWAGTPMKGCWRPHLLTGWPFLFTMSFTIASQTFYLVLHFIYLHLHGTKHASLTAFLDTN